jgi:hypothetical protein
VIVTHDHILTAVAQVISSLNIANIGTPPRVFIVRYPNEFQVTFPAIFVSMEGESERPDERVNVGTDWDYPVRVFYADQDITNTRARLAAELTVRQQLIDAFHMQTPLGLMVVYQCKVVPNVIYDANIPTYQHIVSGMVIWSKMRYVRAVGRSATIPGAPLFQLVPLTGEIQLTVARPVPYGLTYNIYGGTPPGLLLYTITANPDAETTLVISLAPGPPLSYYATSVNALGEGVPSNVVTGNAL